MKLFFSLFLALAMGGNLVAQDVFKQELFATEVIMKYRADINLTDAQTAQIKKMYAAEIGEFNSLKWDLDAAQNELAKLLASSKVDRAKALGKMDEVSGLEEQLKRVRLGMLVDIKNVLTEEQQLKLKGLRTAADLNTPTYHIAAINESPRMVLKVNGDTGGSGEPLFVVINGAGEQSFVTSTNQIKPDDIASVNVLKGDAATQKFGAKGKNGVVIITLKK